MTFNAEQTWHLNEHTSLFLQLLSFRKLKGVEQRVDQFYFAFFKFSLGSAEALSRFCIWILSHWLMTSFYLQLSLKVRKSRSNRCNFFPFHSIYHMLSSYTQRQLIVDRWWKKNPNADKYPRPSVVCLLLSRANVSCALNVTLAREWAALWPHFLSLWKMLGVLPFPHTHTRTYTPLTKPLWTLCSSKKSSRAMRRPKQRTNHPRLLSPACLPAASTQTPGETVSSFWN